MTFRLEIHGTDGTYNALFSDSNGLLQFTNTDRTTTPVTNGVPMSIRTPLREAGVEIMTGIELERLESAAMTAAHSALRDDIRSRLISHLESHLDLEDMNAILEAAGLPPVSYIYDVTVEVEGATLSFEIDGADIGADDEDEVEDWIRNNMSVSRTVTVDVDYPVSESDEIDEDITWDVEPDITVTRQG